VNRKDLGKIGEDISCKFLLKNNYKIIEQNFYYKGGEIDIIAFDKSSNEFVFVEVKTRSNLMYGRAIESVNKVKLNNIIRGAKYFMYIRGLCTQKVRFDAIEVYYTKQKFYINHVKQIIQ